MLSDTVQLITAGATIVTLVALLIQLWQQTKATRDQIEATKNQIYSSFVEDCVQLDQTMIHHVECRKYNIDQGSKADIEKITDPSLKDTIMTLEEQIIDSMENVCTYLEQIPIHQRKTWIDYVESMRGTPAFKFYTEHYNPEWYKDSNAVNMNLDILKIQLMDDWLKYINHQVNSPFKYPLVRRVGELKDLGESEVGKIRLKTVRIEWSIACLMKLICDNLDLVATYGRNDLIEFVETYRKTIAFKYYIERYNTTEFAACSFNKSDLDDRLIAAKNK